MVAGKMISRRAIVLVMLCIARFAHALRFELQVPAGAAVQPPKCIRNFVGTDTLVVIKLRLDQRGPNGQQVDVSITDTHGNNYNNLRDVSGEKKVLFNVAHATAIDVCFMDRHSGTTDRKLSRLVELDMDIGADAIDYNAIQETESLKPVEVELRKITDLTQEVMDTLEYLRQRELMMRNTNESTNDRVKYFAVLSICVLVGLGAWQSWYMKNFFQRKGMI